MHLSPNKFTDPNNDPTNLPRLYGEFAHWFHLLTSPDEYEEEAEIYYRTILSACKSRPKTMLELGSGGGNNASHLKQYFQLTLVDISAEMLKISCGLNPECEHIQGDMRTVRLGRQFDVVFIHDAIMYLKSEEELRQAIATAYHHCKPEGISLFTPDWTRETFHTGVSHGGHDSGDRGLRYLEWIYDPDPADTQYVSHMVYLLRSGNNDVQCIHESHDLGLFHLADWMRILEETGFRARTIPFEHSEVEAGVLFLGIKPGCNP